MKAWGGGEPKKPGGDGAADDLYDTRAQWEYQRPVIDDHGVVWGDRVMHPHFAGAVYRRSRSGVDYLGIARA